MGPPVPREILDPGFDLKPEAAPSLLSAFLKGVDPARNPFLRSPEELKKSGFEGMPYTY